MQQAAEAAAAAAEGGASAAASEAQGDASIRVETALVFETQCSCQNLCLSVCHCHSDARLLAQADTKTNEQVESDLSELRKLREDLVFTPPVCAQSLCVRAYARANA